MSLFLQGYSRLSLSFVFKSPIQKVDRGLTHPARDRTLSPHPQAHDELTISLPSSMRLHKQAKVHAARKDCIP